MLSSPQLIDSIQAFAVPQCVSRAPSGLPKEEIAQPLGLLLSEASQLVHREGAPPLLTDQGMIRGEDRIDQPNEPRWEWPIEALLADRRWWDRWLPDLNEILGRPKAERGRGALGTREAPIVDRRGYADLMEFLFPAVTTSRGAAVSWRSPEYPQVAAPPDASEGSAVVVHV